MAIRSALTVILLVLAAADPAWAQAGSAPPQPASLEYSVKAAFLYKFGPFVDWPAAVFDGPASPFVVCVVGEDPFGPLLDQVAAGQHLGQHPVAIRRIARLERGAPPCHVVFAAGSRDQSPAQVLAETRGEPVLTVTDEAVGDGSRGMIHFIVQDKRVRFYIDARAAVRSGLTLSSKLLSLALSVRETGATP